MTEKTNRIFIVAGETSGDMHAASLINEIKKINPGTQFTGIGGPEMEKAGADLLIKMNDINFMGFSAVVKNLKTIKSALNKCESNIKANDPEVVILVDYPGFNLKLITSIRKFYKGKIAYYISPQLWAWHKSRVKTIKKYVDLMIVVFPFEVDFYDKEGIKAVYAGHPLVKRTDDFLKNNSKASSPRIQISILPGSRKDEIDRMLPVLSETGRIIKREIDCDINILCSPNFKEEYYRKFLNDYDFNLIYDRDKSDLNYKFILNSDFIITKSGTSTVECALIGTPFCVVYKAGKLNYEIGKRLIRIDKIAMVNILAGKEIVKEFLQDEVKPENIVNECRLILSDIKYRNAMIDNFSGIREILTNTDASYNAAKLISQFLKQDQ
ncbi:MAG TPA: lipid-A-disaccharide synthase [Ignavibacteria bacterium]|nr:lipid-A-disaccharide synthase [Ignavibacteria bacterium]